MEKVIRTILLRLPRVSLTRVAAQAAESVSRVEAILPMSVWAPTRARATGVPTRARTARHKAAALPVCVQAEKVRTPREIVFQTEATVPRIDVTEPTKNA